VNFAWNIPRGHGRERWFSFAIQARPPANPNLSPVAAVGDRSFGPADARWLWRGSVFIVLFLAARLATWRSAILNAETMPINGFGPGIRAFQLLEAAMMRTRSSWHGCCGQHGVGVRFFLRDAATVMLLMLRLLAREGRARAGFWLWRCERHGP